MRLVWRLALCTAAVVTPVAGIIELPLNHFSVDDARSDGVYIEVGIGTPSERVAVLLDTGSATLAVPSGTVPNKQLCPDFHEEPAQFPVCPGTTTAAMYRDMGMENFGADGMGSGCVIGSYNYNFSTTHSILPATPSAGNNFTQNPYACNTPGSGPGGAHVCQAGVAYGSLASNEACGQGFSGFLGTDTLTLGSAALCPDCGAEISATVSMVMIETIQSGFQEPPCAGIMGVAFNALNVLGGAMVSDPDTDEATTADDVTAEPDAFGAFLAGAGMANEFSLCMGGPGSPGVLVLGGVDPEYQAGAFQTVGILPGAGYAVPVTEVTVGRHRLGGLDADEQAAIFAGTGAIVDSGTPELVLPGLVYSAMASSIVPCTHNGDCVIGITLSGGVTLAAPGLATCSAGGTCRATRWIRSSGGPQAILGFAVIRNYYTHFDRSARTLGFAQGASGCARAVLPALHAFGADGSVDGSSEGPDELMESKCIQCMDPARGDPDPLSNPEGDDSYGTNKEVDHESKAVVSADSGGQGGNDGGALEAAPAAAADRYPHRSASSDEAYDAVVVTILVATVALLVAVATWRVRRARRAGSESDSPTAMTLLDNEQTDGADSDQENPF